MKRKALRSLVAAALLGASAMVPVSTGTAVADAKGADVVAFGDSFTANGGMDVARSVPPKSWNPQCRTDKANWPKLAGKVAHKSVADYSCNGTMGFTLATYLENAIVKGDLGRNTSDVVLMFGGLSPLFYVDSAGHIVNNPQASPKPYRDALNLLKQRVHQVAPKAKVTLVSYPRLVEDDKVCPALSVPVNLPGATHVERSVNQTVKATAEDLGFGFVDVYGESKGHSPCAPGHERWVNIIPEPLVPSVMPSHPTDKGHVEMGKLVGAAIS